MQQVKRFGLNLQTASPEHCDGDLCWSKPQSGMLKLNIDVVVHPCLNKAGIGWVLRNSQGSLVHAKSQSLPDFLSPKEAEAVGVKEALSWLKFVGFDNCIVELDSLQVIQALRNQDVVSPFGFLIDDCLSLVQHFRNVQFRFVYRTANSVVHACAQAAISVSGSQEWVSPPAFLVSVLAHESCY